MPANLKKRIKPVGTDPSFSLERYVIVQEARIPKQFCFEVLGETEHFGQTVDNLCGLTDVSEPDTFSLP